MAPKRTAPGIRGSLGPLVAKQAALRQLVERQAETVATELKSPDTRLHCRAPWLLAVLAIGAVVALLVVPRW